MKLSNTTKLIIFAAAAIALIIIIPTLLHRYIEFRNALLHNKPLTTP